MRGISFAYMLLIIVQFSMSNVLPVAVIHGLLLFKIVCTFFNKMNLRKYASAIYYSGTGLPLYFLFMLPVYYRGC